MAAVENEIYLQDLKYPFKGKALLNGQTIDYMRDTGSTLTIVKDKYVHENRSYSAFEMSML